MSHNLPRRVGLAPEGRTSNSSPTFTTYTGINLDDSICSAPWWNEVFEASDLKKFTRRTLPYQGADMMTIVSEECNHDHRNVETGWGGGGDTSGVRAEQCYSSTSSVCLLNQDDCSENQSACGGGSSQLLYPSRLKIHAAKIALNSGKEHLSIPGKVRRARHLKNPCHSNCKRCQHPRLTVAERQVILDHFWSLKSHEKQWTFISNAVSVSRPKRKFAAAGSKGEKRCSREYFLAFYGKKRKVCKTMFKNTLSICDSWIDSALSHVPFGLPDLRGKRNKRWSKS